MLLDLNFFIHHSVAFRLNRGVDLNTRKVLTAPDATRIPPHFSAFSEGPTICVEIKVGYFMALIFLGFILLVLMTYLLIKVPFIA